MPSRGTQTDLKFDNSLEGFDVQQEFGFITPDFLARARSSTSATASGRVPLPTHRGARAGGQSQTRSPRAGGSAASSTRGRLASRSDSPKAPTGKGKGIDNPPNAGSSATTGARGCFASSSASSSAPHNAAHPANGGQSIDDPPGAGGSATTGAPGGESSARPPKPEPDGFAHHGEVVWAEGGNGNEWKFECRCGARIQNKRLQIKSHINRKHEPNSKYRRMKAPIEGDPITCLEDGCSHVFSNRFDIIGHLRSRHGYRGDSKPWMGKYGVDL